jgi:hypothetical protein
MPCAPMLSRSTRDCHNNLLGDARGSRLINAYERYVPRLNVSGPSEGYTQYRRRCHFCRHPGSFPCPPQPIARPVRPGGPGPRPNTSNRADLAVHLCFPKSCTQPGLSALTLFRFDHEERDKAGRDLHRPAPKQRHQAGIRHAPVIRRGARRSQALRLQSRFQPLQYSMLWIIDRVNQRSRRIQFLHIISACFGPSQNDLPPGFEFRFVQIILQSLIQERKFDQFGEIMGENVLRPRWIGKRISLKTSR